ncbi:hypothetical protein [Xylophilus ampelinus]|uniref:Uncharacterized protein n=1 Tax=Xylophilus ampelinus TaxID=54067 RepID=A0A318SKY6_9BURK|nr:hypothetical protein [Xylophilus ampelinus]MCS4509149.1 hypothetical protein [Xylophilus ampelinus]PYE79824.1 hypothetical protein DFQ15_101144 [Xylophilus ampelinus]
MIAQHPHFDAQALRLAAAAPGTLDDDLGPALDDEQRDLDALCERWVGWCRTRRLYGPAPLLGSVLGQLSGASSRPMKAGGPDAISSAELSAFHIAYTCQPTAIDKMVFDAYYVVRVKPIKRAADALGISRAHFYRVLEEFRKRVAAAARAIQADNMQQRDALPHR